MSLERKSVTRRTTPQILTRASESDGALVTELVERPLRPLTDGEVLVEMHLVPLHGSFWLAVDPRRRHPRQREFLADGEFVFGNGGVGRVVETTPAVSGLGVGDWVCVFGHAPCANSDCAACRVQERYTECVYNQNIILGHGKGAPDGTFSRWVILTPPMVEVCFRSAEAPSAAALLPYMYAFLIADVRNALDRHPGISECRSLLLFGGGLSGRIAAYHHLRGKGARVVLVEPDADRAQALCAIDPGAIHAVTLDAELFPRLEDRALEGTWRDLTAPGRARIRDAMLRWFSGRTCDVLFDASSGNAAPLWDDASILRSGCIILPFGFGSAGVRLSPEVLQVSGLTLLTSRGVGSVSNRRASVDFVRSGGHRFVTDHLHRGAVCLGTLDEAAAFIRETLQDPTRQPPLAYVTPVPS